MSHPFGDLLTQHLHRKHGLSQSKLAAGILQSPSIVTEMCQGKRLTGPQARERVVAVLGWLHQQNALGDLNEANALLSAAGMSALHERHPPEATLITKLRAPSTATPDLPAQSSRLTRSTSPRHNLPKQLTSFVGREAEMTDLMRLTQHAPLLTLVGVGGAGKTRLAQELGERVLSQFADGVWHVQLAALSDPALLPRTVAQTLKLPEQPGQTDLEWVTSHFEAKQALLILDNCEHLLNACAELASTLLQTCPRLRLLATSREALSVPGEQAWPVMPLNPFAAGQLFVDRARAVQPDFVADERATEVIGQICRKLDGLPLAIELAASRLAGLTLGEIAKRLDDRFGLLTGGSRIALPRHQTLRTMIDWSHDLLTEPERVLLRRLAVFAGGWTLEAAEAVCAEPNGEAVLDLHMQLVQKSLVVIDRSQKGDGETRYLFLETIREYALEKLIASGEAETVRQQHAAFFVELAGRVPPTITSDERKAWYARFDIEQDNFRATLGWARVTHYAELGLRLVGALGEYWFWWASRWVEGWSWISQFLALPEANRPKRARANALRAAVNLLHYLGDSAEADRLADESLALLSELGDKAGMASVLVDKGVNAWDKADFTEAVTLCDESASLFREVGDQRGYGWALTWLAAVTRDQGRFDEAFRLFDAALVALRQAGDDSFTGICVLGLTNLVYYTGDYARADFLAHEALALCQSGGELDGPNYALLHLGRIALAQGDLDRAAAQIEASTAWFRQAQQNNGLAEALQHLGYLRHLQGNDPVANALLREALALQQQQQHKPIEALERCAWVAADMHQPQRAARLFGVAEAERERIGLPFPLGEKPMYDCHLARARADLDELAFDVAWAEGRAMTLDEAVAYAMSESVERHRLL